ncbi:MAG TPA: hypothetical protein VN969_37005 [Streptosporangiaceae bacterium]|nr:hypothetical protein [Streptosporangiaceae bacterium]
MGRLGRALARLVPAGRRDWAEAMWAEAGEVPPGLRRLAWLAGGVQVMASQVLTARATGRWLLFSAAATAAAWAAWPGRPGGFDSVVARMDVVTIVALLAGLPLLARWLLGPAGDGRLARFLRGGGYAAVLALMVAKAGAPRAGDDSFTGPALQFAWFLEILFLVIMAAYVAIILAVTGRRPQVAPATLAIGAGAGTALGAVMYAVAPLGLSKDATEPWLAGSAIDPVVALAWILLLGGPVAAGVMAVRRYRGPGSPQELAEARLWQGIVAGLLATGAGALIVTVLGTATIALMPRAAWLRHWLFPGQHLLAAATHSRELGASSTAGGYGLILIGFPVIGLVLGFLSSKAATEMLAATETDPDGLAAGTG